MRNNKHQLWQVACSLIACAALTPCVAQIYKTEHQDGSVTYSDVPSEGAIRIELDVNVTTIQSSPASAPIPVITTKSTTQLTLTILSPENNATVRNNMGNIAIAASLEPIVGGTFHLHINDQIHQSATGVFTLSNMDRGAYQYHIKFINNSGKVIALSESRTLYLHRASAQIN